MTAPANDAAAVVLAIDPGTAKCGLAVVDDRRRVHARTVVEASGLTDAVAALLRAHPVTHVVVGDRTGARRIAARLREVAGSRPVLPVDEHLSTLEARRRYFRDHPPRGWRRLLPPGLRVPPCPTDDYVAVILAERFLAASAAGQAGERQRRARASK